MAMDCLSTLAVILAMCKKGRKIVEKIHFAIVDASPMRTLITSVVGVLLLVVLTDLKRVVEVAVTSSERTSWPIANILGNIIKPVYIRTGQQSTDCGLLGTINNQRIETRISLYLWC